MKKGQTTKPKQTAHGLLTPLRQQDDVTIIHLADTRFPGESIFFTVAGSMLGAYIGTSAFAEPKDIYDVLSFGSVVGIILALLLITHMTTASLIHSDWKRFIFFLFSFVFFTLGLLTLIDAFYPLGKKYSLLLMLYVWLKGALVLAFFERQRQSMEQKARARQA